MNEAAFHTPVLFLIYNRPEHTRKVFEELRRLRPSQLFVAADGPRMHVPGDQEKCEVTRAVIRNIDWKCELHTLFRDQNKSTKYAVPEAIHWFFEKVEEGIILEDDCVPDLSFFSFCEQVLEKFRNENRVMQINGSNFLKGRTYNFKGSYYFSRLCHPWGWATWKRAWSKYDFEMKDLDSFIRNDKLTILTENPEWRKYYYNLLQQTREGKIDCWDFQWFYTVWSHAGVVITPVINLVSNIGFGKEATNTHYKFTRLAEMKRGKFEHMVFDTSFDINTAADQWSLNIKINEGRGNLFQQIVQKIKIVFRQ
ncbi:MAG TPA: nucleotide-diphospho-sugar transferase [Bacteroidia bacterium]|nr:nucleotide-diphospho-sugar transferase [Bacteroidia bacterium]